jgi:hypothetical protein
MRGAGDEEVDLGEAALSELAQAWRERVGADLEQVGSRRARIIAELFA